MFYSNTFGPEGSLLYTKENREALSSLSSMEKAMNCGQTLESVATLCDTDMNLHIDLGGGIRGIIPREEVVYCRPGEVYKDIAVITRVSKPVCFKILEIRKQNGTPEIILSRKLAQQEFIQSKLPYLSSGDLIRTKVTHLENFGAFVDIGCGVPSLLSVDCISVSRISHPRDRLTVGMNLWNVVRSVDPQTLRVSVSMKELLGTWEENAAGFTPGQTVAGIVRSVEDYGVFVELTPNLAGLAELRCDFTDRPEAIIGQWAAVYIKSIIPERMKIKLSLIDVCRGEVRPQLPKYFLQPDRIRHLEYWRYSPPSAHKIVETLFESSPNREDAV